MRARLHPRRILIIALTILVIGAAATLLGWDIGGWFKHLWYEVTAISLGYLLAGIVPGSMKAGQADWMEQPTGIV
jgi:putative Mn2+ efflux pump MntP